VLITEKKFQFEPLRPTQSQSLPLIEANFGNDEELIVFERNGVYRSLNLREMAYHHVAQGELAGEPYLISF
jgi:hypothetical protein